MFSGHPPTVVRVDIICIIAGDWGPGYVLLHPIQPHQPILMAVVNSLAIGAAVKSAGNLTYKRTRGRTIASQRIVTNASKSTSQTGQRDVFAMQARMAKSIAPWIDLSFPKTKYGSQRNNFVSSAKSALQAFIRVDQIGQGLPDLIQSSAKASELGKLLLGGKGAYTLQCDYPTSKATALDMEAVFSRQFVAGDSVNVMIAQAYTLPAFPDMILESVRIVTKVLDINSTPAGSVIQINSALIPELANLSLLMPAGATVLGQLFCATVLSVNKETSNTTFSSIPWNTVQYNVRSGSVNDVATTLALTLDKTIPAGYAGGTFAHPGGKILDIISATGNILVVKGTDPGSGIIVSYNHAQKVGVCMVNKAGLASSVVDGLGSIEFAL